MTHKDIYTKFMIEYDKANVTSSYPSLTEYEVATVLDKAYNALIAQKVTGNNLRRVALEGDLKSVTDIYPLIKKENVSVTKLEDTNILESKLPLDYLYFIAANAIWPNTTASNFGEVLKDDSSDPTPVLRRTTISPSLLGLSVIDNPIAIEDNKIAKAADSIKYRKMPIKLVSHDMANNFIASSYNIPWVKIPVCFIENKELYVVYDSFKSPRVSDGVDITYIKTPNTFVKPIGDSAEEKKFFGFADDTARGYATLSYFDYELNNGWNLYQNDMKSNVASKYEFECNATVAEELISLAVAFALENVESQRLNSKLNMRGLEA